MRKFLCLSIVTPGGLSLQCGRIYKDAEMLSDQRVLLVYHARLQCGRIYKDAEICPKAGTGARAKISFNVAASIKMRKSKNGFRKIRNRNSLQCGRIYKDAEIWHNYTSSYQKPNHLQCGRIYKDAEI